MGSISQVTLDVPAPLTSSLQSALKLCTRRYGSSTSRFSPSEIGDRAPEPAHIEEVGGVPIELRITGTKLKGRDLALYAEVFVGRAHENKKREPRSLLFSGDSRHVRLEHDLQRVKRFTARLSDRLLMFASSRGMHGLDIDDRPLSGLLIGRAHVSGDIDVEFDIRLPQPEGTASYVGNYVLP